MEICLSRWCFIETGILHPNNPVFYYISTGKKGVTHND